MSFESFPFIIGWELTLACNLRCAHCGSSAGLPRRDELTTAEALDLCEQFPALLVQEVDFTGGEPLLRDDWPVIARRLIALGIPTNVLTNGLAIDRDMVGRLKDVGITGVGISLDGMQATHDYTRGRGSFAAVLNAIGAMQEASLPFNVITTVTAMNLPELPELHQLLRTLGVPCWRLQPLIHMGRVRSHAELQIDSDVILRIGHFVRRAKETRLPHDVQIICSDGLEYVDVEQEDGRPWRGCSAGLVSLGIMSDGRVKGCLSLPDELVEGNVRRERLWDIWFRPGGFAYTRGFMLKQLGNHCRDCDKAIDCKGGCSSSSYCGTGQFHNDAFCFYKAERALRPTA